MAACAAARITERAHWRLTEDWGHPETPWKHLALSKHPETAARDANWGPRIASLELDM